MTRRIKRSPSLHQKRVRFLTVLSFLVMFLMAALLFWLLNRPGFR